MKLHINQADLAEGINIVMKAVPSKTTMTILECILIDARSQNIRLTGNDMEIGIETIVEGSIEEKGWIALDAKFFSEMVRKLPHSVVTIETNDRSRALITCEKARFEIPGRDAEEYTPLPVIEKEESVAVSQFSLKEIVRQTFFAAAVNENNKMMTGELLEIKDNKMKLSALDGHRIAIRSIELNEECPDKKVVVPGKTLNEISKIVSGEMSDMVRIHFSENYLLFEFDKTKVLSRLIEGEYFRIEHMISTDYETKVVINRQEFISCIDRSTPLIRDTDKMPVVLDIRDEAMGLKVDTTIGSMDEELFIEKTGKDLVIGFNPKFLLDALRVIDEEEVSLYFMNAKAPCFIRDEEGRYLYLILPVNIR
ncbi:MAG: DNA polymerase III subunit beta [Eubacterium sp.]|nr:DNA polymerase III subunit beta [Eubacterium sp.]